MNDLPPILLILIPIAYFVGAVPFGLIVGRMRGIDVRTSGSGNIGATNVGRLLGKRYFFLVFFLDLLKSFVPMAIASWVVHRIPEPQRDWRLYLVWLLVGFAAVLGHMFSVFLKFKGGKGVASSAGMMLGLAPYYTLPGLLGSWCSSSSSRLRATSAWDRLPQLAHSPCFTSCSVLRCTGRCLQASGRCWSLPC
jgi:glycerol-3-phosphate acyltransferase PlsY